jgi:acyl phosphate:glycerol-3-phosphate acyltransferase
MIDIVLAAVVGYLLGSIPTGLIAGRLAGGVDLRDYGSGKTGFTNSLRVLGLRRSAPVFIGDFAKGLAAALLPLLWTDDPWARAIGALAAVLGHVWPMFAGFRGGRGVLTGAGAIAGLNPVPLLLALPLAALVLYATRYMSLVSIATAAVLALLFMLFAAAGVHDWAFAVAAALGAALVIALHHDNIGRLLAGNERRVGERSEQRAIAPEG